MNSQIEQLLSFLKESPSAFHAVDAIEKRLPGFEKLSEAEPWKLLPGGKYYVTRNRSSIIAFTVPQETARSFRIVASHSDSPCFKIKENAEITVRNHYVQLDTERYGGMIMSTWLDRPLSVAGRVIVRTDHGVATRLVNLDRDTVLIPNVAIHMNREVNNGYKFNPAVDMNPLFGSMATAGSFRKMIAESAGVRESDLIGTDLFLYNRVPGIVWGAENEYISAGRLDDLECAFTSMQSLTQAEAGKHINLCAVMDNEEVGSLSKQGADSTFLRDTLERIHASGLPMGGSLQQMLAASFMVSADNAHAVHPNHPEYSDPANCAYMNEGVVIKFNALQKYTTDAVSQSLFREICAHAQVPVQYFANRSDMAGGSTLGNISNAHVSLNMVDIGLPQLAMHSAYETAGVKDVGFMIRALRGFYETEISVHGDGEWTLDLK